MKVRYGVAGAAVALLLVMIFEVALSTRQQSPSWDEGDHIYAGYMNWKNGEYTLNPEHPPLVKLVATLPLLPLDLKTAPRHGDYFKNEAYFGGRELIYRNDPKYGGKYSADTLLLRIHLAAMTFGIVLAAVLFIAGKEMFGVTAGLITLAGDDATVIDGATIEVREAGSGTLVSSATSDSTGAYAAAVMTVPADYLVTVKKTGYRTLSETVTVPAEQRLIANFSLTPGTDEVAEAQLHFVEPQDGATVVAANVTLYGQVNGFDVATVMVNGQPAELVGAGGFSITLRLTEGKNTINAAATGVNGQTVSGVMTLTYAPPAKKKGCGCSSGTEVLVALAALVLVRRRARV